MSSGRRWGNIIEAVAHFCGILGIPNRYLNLSAVLEWIFAYNNNLADLLCDGREQEFNTAAKVALFDDH